MSTTPDLFSTPHGSTTTGVFAAAAGSPTPGEITAGSGSELPLGAGGLPPVLDACCGSRMFWFDKRDQRALFVDKRRETLTDNTGKRPAEIVVDPDVLADFGALPFGDASFSLVVFDPPHTFCGPNGRTIKKYGTLPLGWRNMLTRGFAECFRVLCPGGTLVFKWNEHRVKLSTVLSLTPEQPLFGQRVGNTLTHWLVFLKGGGGGSETSPRHSESGNSVLPKQ